jgi:hypothetical protein
MYLFSLPLYDSSFSSSYIAFLTVAYLLSFFYIVVVFVFFLQLKSADQGRNNPVAVSRLALVGHVVFSVLQLPILRLLTTSLVCTDYKNGTVVGWKDVGCTSLYNLINMAISVVIMGVVFTASSTFHFLVISRSPTSRSMDAGAAVRVPMYRYISECVAVVGLHFFGHEAGST